ncbi:MAG: hypothetical protein WKG32_09460, partial [Gemmatimonadaceae bacterium]
PARDEHATAVLDELARMECHAELFDLADFPRGARLSLAYGAGGAARFTLRYTDGREVDLTACRAAWWRRPLPFEMGDDITGPGEHAFAYTECHEAITGLWHALDARWVNDPAWNDVAAKKTHQLRAAAEVGLRVPETLVTNDPGDARAFAERVGAGRTIYKSFLATEEYWRETRLLRPEELALLDHLAVAPVIFQEFVPAAVDLRITIVGDRIFPAAIHSQETGYPVDFRMELETVRIEPATLPASVEEALHRLMARLGISYGAVDMRRTPAGEHVFLEVNPAGEWLFVERRTEQPITRALAELLAALDRPGTGERTAPPFSRTQGRRAP